MKTYCIEINGNSYKMNILSSDMPGYYLYELVPLEHGYDKQKIYIAPNRADHIMNNQHIDSWQISYFFRLEHSAND